MGRYYIISSVVTTAFPAGTFADGNSISDWSYRVKVTIPASSVTADLTNFLWMIDLSDLTSTSFFSAVRSDGGDIRITKSDGTTELANYNSQITTGSSTGIHWARIDGTLSSSSDNEFYIYYGNATATEYATTATYGRNNTFQDLEMIGDFEQDPSGSGPQWTDLTGNSNDGTTAGSMTSGDEVSGKVGNAWDFEGTDDYVDVGDETFSQGQSELTIDGWWNFDSFSVADALVRKWTAGEFAYYLTLDNDSPFDGLAFGVASSQSDDTRVEVNNVLTTSTWHHIVATFSGTTLKIYVDGSDTSAAVDVSNGTLTTIQNVPEHLALSARYNSGSPDFHADVKSSLIGMRVTALSSNYISTEYNNQNSPATFYSVGSEET